MFFVPVTLTLTQYILGQGQGHIYEYDPDILKMWLRTRNELSRSRLSKVEHKQDRQRQTDRQTDIPGRKHPTQFLVMLRNFYYVHTVLTQDLMSVLLTLSRKLNALCAESWL